MSMSLSDIIYAFYRYFIRTLRTFFVTSAHFPEKKIDILQLVGSQTKSFVGRPPKKHNLQTATRQKENEHIECTTTGEVTLPLDVFEEMEKKIKILSESKLR